MFNRFFYIKIKNMKILKNETDWKHYSKAQENRVLPNSMKHVNIPQEFPCIIITHLQMNSDGNFNALHYIISKKEASKLLSL